jgi:type I restriction enzyme M protein
LGKCCVYYLDTPAIADGHVTIIRPDTDKVDSYYLAEFLRYGFVAKQISRLYTGSIGPIEVTPDQVDNIVVYLLGNDIKLQKLKSQNLRLIEKKY